MEFKEMQVIWNNQNNEKLYAINEETLYKQIKKKGRSVTRLLTFFEGVMIFVNLIVGIILIMDTAAENGSNYEYLLAALYLGFSVYAIFRRLARHKEEVHFAPTMLGELDKAIWQMNYLLKQGQSIIYWYLLPLVVVFSLTMFLDGKYLWGILFPLFLIPATYYGTRWEARKWHLPKKHDLETLREMLTAESSNR